jgi:hypothetical protein
MRVGAYALYYNIYWGTPKTFKVIMRGQDGEPIYVPSGRKIVEIAHRYVAPGFNVVADPLFGQEGEQIAAMQLFTDFFRREMLGSRFSAAKRDGLIEGDSLWHLYADPERSAGARLSLYPLDPGVYFPEYGDGNVDEVIAVHLVEPTLYQSKSVVRKLSYTKETGRGGPSPIIVSDVLCPTNEWGQPDTDMKETIITANVPDFTLPSPIDSIPVYHIPNVFEPRVGWGSSEMRGIERLMAAINQGITDEELTLVMEGLGVYVTDAGSPVDAQGNVLPWNLGPARVVELPNGKTFTRVTGTSNVTPYQDHLKYLAGSMEDVTGHDPSAIDVQVAESGIALAFRMAPLLARATEKDLVIDEKFKQILFDLRNWFAAYEGVNLDNIRWIPAYADKLPVNKKELFNEIIQMLGSSPPLISLQEGRRQLERLGWAFTADDTNLWSQILEEQGDFATIQADAVASRIAGEAAGPPAGAGGAGAGAGATGGAAGG